MEMNNATRKQWPETIADAIRVLDAVLPDSAKDEIRAIALEDLHVLHQGLGTFIRNEFGLWAGNDALITTTLEIDPDLASMTIIREFWDHLQARPVSKLH
jgi:hypothetical protein